MKLFVLKHIKKAKLKYYTDYFKQYSSDSRKQWQLINSLLNKNRNKIKISKLSHDGTDITTPNGISDTFNTYFTNIATKLKNSDPRLPKRSPSNFQQSLSSPVERSIYLREVEVTEIDEIIKSLKNKSTSDTSISALKAANEIPGFQSILASLLNASFHEGVFPEQLKLAKVVPIHKAGKRSDVSNYRPISLLSSFSNVFEKSMHRRITKFLESNNTLYEHQYGFRKGHSCEHALHNTRSLISLTKNRYLFYC